MPPPDDGLERLNSEEVYAAISQVCGSADFARAKSIARARAVGLLGLTAEDLLHEAMTSLMSGVRRWPRGEHPLVVLKTAMHSIASNARKRTHKGAIDPHVPVAGPIDDGADSPEGTVSAKSDNMSPMNAVDARSQLDAIQKLVAGDEEVELVVMAWADGLRGKEAAEALGFNMKTYEAARKRLIRKLEPLAALRREK